MTSSSLTYRGPLFVILFCTLALLIPCATKAAVAPLPSGINAYVMDQADLLGIEVEQKLSSFLRQFEASDSTQIAVVTVTSLQGREINEYSVELAANSGLGQKGLDNGALLLVAREERKVRIEVGKGLEGTLTDLQAGRIIDTEIVPRFKQGRFDEGIVAGVAAMAASVRGEYSGTGNTERERNPFGWLIMLLFLAPGLLPFGSRRRRSGFIFFPGSFGGGRGGSGGFSGGGGGFGGGGASGSW